MNDRNLSRQQAAAPRYDIYAIIHKALRAFMCDTLVSVGNADADDAKEVAAVLAQVRELAAFCASHLKHENDFVHPAMEAAQPGAAAQTAGDHLHHEWALRQVGTLADAVDAASTEVRAAALGQLYRYLAVFVAENFTHMNIEETDNNAVLWAACSDEELMGIEHAIVASIPPDEMAASMRWMIPAMTANERAAALGGMRAGAPAPVFDAVLGIAHTYLSERDWNKLALALALPERLAA
ncbi:hypothetical protein D3870_08995 [Noviherbaspirillum cavernae]|uniref:Hemerythrin-like domain-containing protein n=1 Tax=Noviherbaspirillum cavernae TaxID=2320862 RepID=A0A418X102_9BURK|nr:hemerythrin domain-containing protein [Noviherbaspirillum cavernae]RJG06122.1 hypothetical protein D3870_08995 [Noviherbaspirillum cavernae]